MLGIERVELSTKDLEEIRSLPVFPLADAYPLMDGEPFLELADDVARHGVLNAILIFNGQLLDGRNRLKAVVTANKSLPEEDRLTSLLCGIFEGSDEEAEDLVISLNERRRDLTTGQRAIVANTHRSILEERAKARQLATLPQEGEQGFRVQANLPAHEVGQVRDILAEKHNVGARNIDHIQRLKRASEETVQDPNTSDPEIRMPTPLAVKAVNGLRAIESGKETVNAVVEKVFKAKNILSNPDDDTPLIIAQKKFVQAKLKVKECILDFHKVDDSDERLEFILDALDVLRQTAKETFGQWEENDSESE